MAISDKTRKLLWGLAGARCSYCQCSLVMNATDNDAESIVGDECHIHARHERGPRRNASLSEDGVDDYENLILLCKVHHKLVDDQPEKYTADYLKVLKAKHESWVNSELQPKKVDPDPIAIRVGNATDVVRLIEGVYGYDFQHDELETEEEVGIISNFLQDLHDYGDISSEMGAAERTRFIFTISQQMKGLDRLGFAVFMGRYVKKYRVSDSIMDFSITSLRVVRKTNPTIQTITPDEVDAAVEELNKQKTLSKS